MFDSEDNFAHRMKQRPLVERLRDRGHTDTTHRTYELMDEAADAIELLEEAAESKQMTVDTLFADLRVAYADLSLLMRAVADYRDFMRDVLHGAMHPEMAPVVGALNEIEQRHPKLVEAHRSITRNGRSS